MNIMCYYLCMNRLFRLLPIVISICIVFTSCSQVADIEKALISDTTTQSVECESLYDVPEFSDFPYVVIDDNQPHFTESQITTDSFEYYGELDSLGRCTTAVACVGRDIMPTEERQSIGSVKPTGWHTVKYENVDGKYLYNRCHLIAYRLTGENANERNLITGTRYLNIDGMLGFEEQVGDYVRDTGNHVMYSVTPVFEGDNLVASGVNMQAYSVEDRGKGISFNVYCYNNQPGVIIDYATGDSVAADSGVDFDNGDERQTYIVNINTKKFHTPTCDAAKDIAPGNRKQYKGLRQNLVNNGYTPCGRCNP